MPKTHQKSTTLIYKRWLAMRARCLQKNRKDSHVYRDRGVKFCKQWDKFENFYKDMNQTFEKHLAEFSSTILDRINNKKGYSLSNCRWVTFRESVENKRNSIWVMYEKQKIPLRLLSEKTGISIPTLYGRIKTMNMSVKKAVSIKGRLNKKK